MLNYACDASVLRPFVPQGTELDMWDGTAYISVVGFQFLDTRVRGLPVPFHRNFEEVNLRFYVRRKCGDEWRRGVVFVKELVPRRAVAAVARYVYGENYEALPMRHRVSAPMPETEGALAYEWHSKGSWNGIYASFNGDARSLAPGSEQEFIAEHYWGYTMRQQGTLEYRVEHPSWRVWKANSARLVCDAAALYGAAFAETLAPPPKSAFIADGSAVSVWTGAPISVGGHAA